MFKTLRDLEEAEQRKESKRRYASGIDEWGKAIPKYIMATELKNQAFAIMANLPFDKARQQIMDEMSLDIKKGLIKNFGDHLRDLVRNYKAGDGDFTPNQTEI